MNETPTTEIEAVFITEQEAAAILSKAVQSMRNERHQGRGLPYYKVGRSVRYFKPEVYQQIRANRIEPGRG